MAKGKPKGMNYAQVLRQRHLTEQAIKDAARDLTLRVEADTRVQRALWMSVCAVADAYGIGPARMSLFFQALQDIADEVETMTKEVDADYAYEKLRHRAQQVTGREIEYLYEHDRMAIRVREAQETAVPNADVEEGDAE